MAVFTRGRAGAKAPYFGLTGGWLTFWVVGSFLFQLVHPHAHVRVSRRVPAVFLLFLLLKTPRSHNSVPIHQRKLTLIYSLLHVPLTWSCSALIRASSVYHLAVNRSPKTLLIFQVVLL